MAVANRPSLESLWEKASKEYQAQQEIIDKEDEKAHHFFHHKHKKPSKDVPELKSAEDFAEEIRRHKAKFTDMRLRNHKVFEVMSAMATPVGVIGGAASNIGGVVRSWYTNEKEMKLTRLSSCQQPQWSIQL